MRIAIIGKGFRGLKTYLEENNHEYVLFKDSLIGTASKSGAVVSVDFRDLPKTIEIIKSKGTFDCTITIYEQYITVNAKIARALGLPGLSDKSAEACTNKFVMRTLFSKAPKKISPEFRIVDSWGDIELFMKNHSYPVILKPANLAKSLLVTKNSDLGELKLNYEKTLSLIDGVYKKYAPRSEPMILIEEFMQGSIHSIDAFIDKNGNVALLEDPVDYETGYDIGYNDNFHYSRIIPSALTKEAVQNLKEVAVMGVESLGIKSSAAHIEIIVNDEGARIVEIGARNGGYRERMHLMANDIDIYGALINTVTDRAIDIAPKKHHCSSVLELFPKQKGIYRKLRNQAELEALSSFYSLSIKYKPGEICGKSSDGFNAVAVIVLCNSNKQIFDEDLAYIKKYVSVETE